MTELQMGLIGLGALAVVGVVAYNKWQEMRQRKQAESVLKASHPDVLLEGSAPEAAAGMAEPGGEPREAAVSQAPELPSESDPVLADARVEPVLRYEPEPEILESPEPSEPAVTDESMPPEQEIEPVQAMPAGATAAPRMLVEPISPAGSIVEDPRFLSPRIDFIAAIDAV